MSSMGCLTLIRLVVMIRALSAGSRSDGLRDPGMSLFRFLSLERSDLFSSLDDVIAFAL